jgi:rod shape-determining protein MreC
VSSRDSGFGELKVPLTWTAAVALVVAIVVAVALLMSDRRETFQAEAYGVTRKAADAVAAPVNGVLATPTRWIGDGVNGVKGYFFAVSENRRLKAELREMKAWRDAAIALRDTNERYRTILGLKTDPPIPMVGARIITDSRGPFANTRLANAGKESGVKPGHPVMSENGLVGRVIGVTTGVSRVLLLTDVASRTPVMIDRNNARAILTGDGSPNPRLDYLRGKDAVRPGDRILTSGDGGVLPRGLPVGTAVKGLDGRWRVSLASDSAPIDYVRILKFEDFSQLADFRQLGQMAVPPPAAGTEPTITTPSIPAPPPPAGAAGAPPLPAAPRPAAAASPAAPPAKPAPAPPQKAAAVPAPRPTPPPAPSVATPPAQAPGGPQ